MSFPLEFHHLPKCAGTSIADNLALIGIRVGYRSDHHTPCTTNGEAHSTHYHHPAGCGGRRTWTVIRTPEERLISAVHYNWPGILKEFAGDIDRFFSHLRTCRMSYMDNHFASLEYMVSHAEVILFLEKPREAEQWLTRHFGFNPLKGQRSNVEDTYSASEYSDFPSNEAILKAGHDHVIRDRQYYDKLIIERCDDWKSEYDPTPLVPTVTQFFNAPVRVVNLDEYPRRWEKAREALTSAGFENLIRYSATDGRDKTLCDQLDKDLGLPRPLSRLGDGQRGCALSHYRLYQELVESDLPWMVISEDDTRPRDDFQRLMEVTLNMVKEAYDKGESVFQLLIGNCGKGLGQPDLRDGIRLQQAHGFSTNLYIIWKEGAQRMLDFARKREKKDPHFGEPGETSGYYCIDIDNSHALEGGMWCPRVALELEVPAACNTGWCLAPQAPGIPRSIYHQGDLPSEARLPPSSEA